MRSRWVFLLGACSLIPAGVACHDGSTGPAEPIPGTAGIHLASGTTLADTALATLPLTVVVVDSALRAASGVLVRFAAQAVPDTGYPGYFDYPVLVALPDSQRFTITVAATTDGGGRASARVGLGGLAGKGSVVVSAPQLGFSDTVAYTIDPGALAGVTLAPRDTAVYAGRQYRLRGHAVDRNGNLRADSMTFAVASGPVSVDSMTGQLTTLDLGRASVVARTHRYADTVHVSVVPQAQVATQEFVAGNGGPIGLFLMQLDGSGRQLLATGLNAYFGQSGVGWSPDGQELALPRDSSVDLLAPGGPEVPLVKMKSAVLQATRFSPDGKWVYFAVAGSDSELPGLYRLGADGTGLQHLGTAGIDFAPAPSADGLSVAYLSYRTPCGVTVCVRVLDLATNSDRMYGSQDFLDAAYGVSWSPTQDLVVYQNALRQLVLLRSDGTQSRVVAQLQTYVKWLDWSPDGQWLVVAEVGVSLINVQTGLRLPIAQLASYGATVWRP